MVVGVEVEEVSVARVVNMMAKAPERVNVDK